MEHSKNFNKVKTYYDEGFWNEAKVRNAVVKGWITETEFSLICNKPYEE